MLPHNLDERREAPRCAIDLPIRVERHGAAFDGRTRDLSEGGLAVTLPLSSNLSPGHAISFVVVLQHLVPDSPMQLEGTATVVRVARAADDTVVAFRSRWLTTAPLERALRAYVPALTHEDK